MQRIRDTFRRRNTAQNPAAESQQSRQSMMVGDEQCLPSSSSQNRTDSIPVVQSSSSSLEQQAKAEAIKQLNRRNNRKELNRQKKKLMKINAKSNQNNGSTGNLFNLIGNFSGNSNHKANINGGKNANQHHHLLSSSTTQLTTSISSGSSNVCIVNHHSNLSNHPNHSNHLHHHLGFRSTNSTPTHLLSSYYQHQQPQNNHHQSSSSSLSPSQQSSPTHSFMDDFSLITATSTSANTNQNNTSSMNNDYWFNNQDNTNQSMNNNETMKYHHGIHHSSSSTVSTPSPLMKIQKSILNFNFDNFSNNSNSNMNQNNQTINSNSNSNNDIIINDDLNNKSKYVCLNNDNNNVQGNNNNGSNITDNSSDHSSYNESTIITNDDSDYDRGNGLLQIPMQNKIRSASFDDSRSSKAGGLMVPQDAKNVRSKSFDHSANIAGQQQQQQQQSTTTTRSSNDNQRSISNKRSDSNVSNQSTSSTTSNVITFLDVPKWKLLIRRSSATTSSSSGSSSNQQQSQSQTQQQSNQQSNQPQSNQSQQQQQSPANDYSQLSLMCKDCAHCQYMYEMLQEQQQQQQQLQQQQRLETVDEDLNSPNDRFDADNTKDSINSSDNNAITINTGQYNQLSPNICINNKPEATTNDNIGVTGANIGAGGAAAPALLEAMDEFDVDEFIEPIDGLPIVTLCPPELSNQSSASSTMNNSNDYDNDYYSSDNSYNSYTMNDDDDMNVNGSGITVISLEVPVIDPNSTLSSSKQSRSASVDSPYLLQVPKRDDIEVGEGPPKARSKSVDIVLPTHPGGPYLLIPPKHPPTTTKKTVQGEIKIQAENGETRILRSAPDWTESAILGDHIWVSTSTSGSDLCYVGENKCTKIGPRLCCPACKVTAHTGCMSILLDNMKFQCKPTFKDGVRQYREQTYVKHHWVHRRHEKGRCKHCGKSFQSKLSFGNKEIVAVSCSWCKSSYHNREPCFTKTMLENNCDFGIYQRFIVPSSWIVKLPRKGSFKSSIRRTPRNKRLSSKKRSSIKQQQAQQQLQSTNKAPNTTTTATTNTDQHSSTNSSQQSLINDNNHHRNTNNSNVLLQISPTSIVVDDFYPPLKSAPPPSPPPPTTTTTTPLSMNNNSSSSAKQSLPNQSSTISTTSSTTSPQPPTPATTVMSESLDNDNNTMSSSIQLSPSSNSNFESISNSTNNWCLIGDNNNGDDNLVVVDGGDYNNNEQSIIDKNKSIDLDSNDTDKLDDKTLETLKQITNAINNRTTASSTTAAETAAAAPPIVYTSVATNRAPKHRRHSHANVMPTQPLNSSGGVNSNDKSSNNAPHSSVQVVNNRVEQYLQHVHRSFVIKPIPSANLRPLLVFINPKSGGNQGAKLMQKFQWHLNPRQVFDLSQGGPRLGLDLYKKVHNLRILACGGDGTAGWVLSAIDEIAIQPPPPISVLPLGTGNDLARSFGWGGSYTDEPIAKILCNILEGQVVQLDRWNLKVSPNYQCIQQQQQQQQKQQSSTILDDNKDGKQELPLNVVNNYFSIGVDAHIALSFHEAREAHPERFNSRLRNKMFYGQAGGKDLLQRKWKDLCNYVNLECDGKDFTNRLKELKVHSVLFLNIPSYGGGTRPWPTSSAPSNLQQPKTDDGYIEVIGLTTYQLPLLQAGGHGTIITQCRQAKIVTSRTIPMQVDGEPCRLLPSLINLELRNKVNVVANTKTFEHKRQMPALQKITLKIRKLNLNDYETYHYDKDKLKEISTLLGSITIDQVMELSNVRIRINEMMKEKGLRRPSSDLSSITTTTSTTSNQSSSLIDSQSKPLPICYENVTSSTTSTEPRPLQSQSSITNSSVSIASKFVSNDWCFVDSVTAERFFRIDRAQEELYYVVDICHDDLFILDPQFDEKDDLDLFTSEEVIAKVVADVSAAQSAAAAAASASFHNDSTNADNELQQQQTNQNNSIKNQNQNKSTELNYNNQNNNEMMNNLTNNTTNDVKSSKKMMPKSLNLNNYINNNSNNNHNHNNNNSSNNNSNIPNDSSANMEPYYRQMCKLDNNNTLRLQSNQFDSNVDDDHQDSSHDNSSNANDNSLIQPKSPLRKHKMLSSLSPMKSSQQQEQSRSNRRKLQNQLMLAARNGDISLLKHLHHKGLNLMLVDDKGMSALHYAVMYNQEEAVAFLSNAFTKEMLDLVEPEHGHTALHKAIIGDKRNICLTLVLRGARLDLCDNSGQTIEQLGRNLGHHDLLKTLLHVSQACNRETAV